jgi:hypothetical protein
MKNLNIAESVTVEKPIHVKDDKSGSNKDRLKKFVEEESVLVKGRFRCYETPGSTQRIQQRKYKEVPMFDKYMTDGQVYEVPLWVARWLNGIDVTAHSLNGKINSCSYPVHGFKMGNPNDFRPSQEIAGNEGPMLVPMDNIVKRERRYGFESLEFSVE